MTVILPYCGARTVMLLYHTTYAAKAILAEGFRDGEGTYLTDQVWRGVWLADRPLDANDGAYGDTVLVIEVPEEVVTPYEWIEDYSDIPEEWRASSGIRREFLLPAEIVNRYGPPWRLE
jgi:hypothetical protein